MELLATTLNQAHALFYTLPEGLLPDPSLPCGLLFSTLETITGQHPTGKLIANLFFYLLVHSNDVYSVSAIYYARLWGYSSELDKYGTHLCRGNSLAVEADFELKYTHTCFISVLVFALNVKYKLAWGH